MISRHQKTKRALIKKQTCDRKKNQRQAMSDASKHIAQKWRKSIKERNLNCFEFKQ
jgi:hypothetical protein